MTESSAPTIKCPEMVCMGRHRWLHVTKKLRGSEGAAPGNCALGTDGDDDEGSHDEDAGQDSRHDGDDRRDLPPAAQQLAQVVGQAANVHIQQCACTAQQRSPASTETLGSRHISLLVTTHHGMQVITPQRTDRQDSCGWLRPFCESVPGMMPSAEAQM